MKLTTIRLGDHIKRVVLKNKDGKVRLDNYLTASFVHKELVNAKKPKVLLDSDVTQYKVVTQGQFVFCPIIDAGNGLPVGRMRQEIGIVSSSYEVFEVDSAILLPEYLNLLLSTVQIDNHVDYFAHGTARRSFSWDMMCDLELEIPSVEDQIKVVNTFQKLNRLIDLKLETLETLQELGSNLFRKLFCTVDEHSMLKVKPADEFTLLKDCVYLQRTKQEKASSPTVRPNRTVETPYPAFSNTIFQDQIYGFIDHCDSTSGQGLVTVDRVMGEVKIRYQPSKAINGVFTLECDPEKCTPEYLFYYLSNTHIVKTGTNTSRQESTLRSLGKHKVYLADLELQKLFSEQVKPLLKLAEQCVYDLYELRQLRKAWLTDFRPELLSKASLDHGGNQ